MFNKVLICLDGSSPSEQILQYASNVASIGGKIVLLSVVPSPYSYKQTPPKFISAVPPVPPSPEQLAEEEEKVKQYLNAEAEALKRAGIDVECVVEMGKPRDIIVDYANRNNIDLIAIVTHGRRGLGRILFGSVAEYVVKHSKLPVLLVKV